ncbi:MAG TPA: hypothetical protein GXX26_08730 [Clostridiaceae bacterium]|nr:hypothetical protein [Clostridiaceae bacterium]
MKIVDSRVRMDAKWYSARQQHTKETVEFWTNGQILNTKDNILIDISEKGKSLQQKAAIAKTESQKNENEIALSDEDKEKIKLIEDFIYLLTGKRIKFLVLDTERLKKEELQELEKVKDRYEQGLSFARPQGWGLKYDRYEYFHDSEKMSFSSSGSVTTADGRVIDFNLSFHVSREFIREETLSIRAGDALIDPLVINFKNSSATLGDRNYSFDIDLDGNPDTIAFTGYGSGFLALDLNNNGIIDDGSELFGPRSGNGFEELAEWDQDKNGWIDENDEIFSRLRIWTLDETGNKTLLALGQAGVGAIYLGNVRSEFGLKTETNEQLGQIRSSGIFLKETGEAGTTQHVDLAI